MLVNFSLIAIAACFPSSTACTVKSSPELIQSPPAQTKGIDVSNFELTTIFPFSIFRIPDSE